MYIIGTVGPNVKDRNSLKGIIDNGVNALRFNFAHGSENDFDEFLKMAKEISSNIDIILDLSGTKVRVSNKFEYIYKIYDNEEIYFCGEDKYEEIRNKINRMKMKIIPLNIKNKMLNEKDYKQITIKDNTMIFNVIGKVDEFIKVSTIKGGIIRRGKGCNIKELDRSILSLSSKDKKAIEWGIRNDVDIICQSFVEDIQDIEEIKSFLDKNIDKKFSPKIWAKIETVNGINNMKKILNEVDGIVIGRGDLIPETSIEDTPIYEDRIISEVVEVKDKDIIIATHVLNSMKNGKMPSISEVESVYNFIKSGVTGFLLAGETSVGKAPIRTVEFLKNLITKYSI
ncbi:pyruvate kinase [Clostridium saccharobutylicum]|nr:pyruvate kinase [Clostridium saccharobutylicum]AQR91318.1 pyruvate kinase [Clostridium saccharobutylicum]AQS01222.1 pyruvate kinase [Clostridium saccharobutylicum]AQS15205.1 pyruvate kinase [Clostridium saccharobutylicum]MBA2905335.1 pyruvate kinase [Clostridium saccharobutylicum]MBA8789906.1 pyruvate kinase [Clostridium saccharobutylicum]